MAIKKDGQRTKHARRKHVEQETPKDAEHGRPMTMIDPWDMLLEQLLAEPTDNTVGEGGAEERRPAARAQPEAGSTIEPKRPRKRRGKQ